MNTRNASRPPVFTSKAKLLCISIFVVLVALTVINASSASSLRTAVSAKTIGRSTSLFFGLGRKAGLLPFLPQTQAPPPAIDTFDSTCATPDSDFNLGQTVCATATNTGGAAARRRISWVDPEGFVRKFTSITTDPQNDTFDLPSTPTSTLSNGQVVTNVGTWRVSIISSRGSLVATKIFLVKDPQNATADLSADKRSATDQVAAGSSGTFKITVFNSGPDDADQVVLTDVVPANTTFVSMIQSDGPTFSCTAPGSNAGTVTCTIASFPVRASATFSFNFTVNNGTPAGTQITNTATVSSDTNEGNPKDNSSTAVISVSGGGGGGLCTVSCPDDITTQANTTDNGTSGAIVHFTPPSGSDECGAVTADHCNDCFFPEGTTTVTATASTGESCSFMVTVTPPAQAGAPTISCPVNKTATADSNCQAAVAAGTPTTTGENVTVTSTRSDGRALSDPYPSGTTTITWTATNSAGSATCQQTITVKDTTPPNIDAPPGETASADASCQAAIPDFTATATTSDNCAASDAVQVTQDPEAGTLVGPGQYTVILTAHDGSGNTTTDTTTFTVKDTTAPTITCPANITSGTDLDTCAANIDPGTATATDNCDVSPTVTGTRSDGQPLNAPYPQGTTTITWTATDDDGNSSSCPQTVTVNDTQNPTIILNGQSPTLWPPNHKYHTFPVTSFVTGVNDNCGTISVSNVVIAQVTSDESENGNGDGNTNNDIIIAADCKSVQLRAERQGGGNGRVYTIVFSVSDAAGNTSTASTKVVVPKNPNQTPVDSGPHYTVTSNCP